MSEYQYHEFQAIDRPLDAKGQAVLRQYSTRAKISSRRFANEYHWGDFKGNEVEWMKTYFDAHVYLSNFGSRALHLRLPLSLVNRKALRPYETKHVMCLHSTAKHLVYCFYGNTDSGREYDQFDEAPSAALATLLPVRDMLARGDLRPLYLGWLAAVRDGGIDDRTQEPPVPPGLGRLDPGLEALRDFLWIEPALVEVAARHSGAAVTAAHAADDIRAWLGKLPAAEKDEWLSRFLDEADGTAAIFEFRGCFARERPPSPEIAARARRSAGELQRAAEELAEQWRQAAAHKAKSEAAARGKKAAEKRRRHLISLQGQETNLWKSVIALTATSIPSNYDAAVSELADLRDLAGLTGDAAVFAEKLGELRELRRRKPTLIQRLDKAGLK